MTVQKRSCLPSAGALGCGGLLVLAPVVTLIIGGPVAALRAIAIALGVVAIASGVAAAVLYRDEQRRKAAPALGFLAVVAGVAAAGTLLLPLGPDVSKDDLRGSIAQTVESRPNSGAEDVHASCDGSAFSNRNWECHVEEEIPNRPNRDVTYHVTVQDNRCWFGVGTDLSGRRKRLQGCVDQ